MTALEVVKDERPAVVTADAIAAALERRKAESAAPLEHYDPEIGGVFTYRRLTGAEVRDCRRLATVDLGKTTQRVDQDKLEFYIVNKATVEPKVTAALWSQLGQLGPIVQAGLSAAVFEACGLIGDPVADAGKDSSESPI
jgi:hypothetical protein